MKKILLLCPSFNPRSGWGTVGYNLSTRLSLDGYEIFQVGYFSEKDKYMEAEMLSKGEDVFFMSEILYAGRKHFFMNLLKIFKIGLKSDIIHAHDWPFGFYAALVNIFLKKKLIITGHGTYAVKPMENRMKKILFSWAYRQANNVTAVSNYTANKIKEYVPNLKIEIINNGVDFDKFNSVYTN